MKTLLLTMNNESKKLLKFLKIKKTDKNTFNIEDSKKKYL